MSIVYRITRDKLNSGRQYRQTYKHYRVHGFRHLYWIKKIKFEFDNELAHVYWVFGLKSTYSINRVTMYYILRDCGFSDTELEIKARCSEGQEI